MYLLQVIEKITKHGVESPPSRAYYIDEAGDKRPATTRYILNWNEEYDLQKGESPLVDIRPIGVKKAIGELLWMYQDKSNVVRYTLKGKADTKENSALAERQATLLHLPVSLEGKYDVRWWRDWTYQEEVPGTDLIKHHIGNTYGAIIARYNPLDKVRAMMKENPYNRRSIVSMWQYDEIEYIEGERNTTDKEALLPPCFYSFHLDVRTVEGVQYLDLKLEGRSSDYLLASNQDRIQYTAMLLILANELGMQPGKLYVNYMNVHIYCNQWNAVEDILERLKLRTLEEVLGYPVALDELASAREALSNAVLENLTVVPKVVQPQPRLVLNALEGTSFYDVTLDDFTMIDYAPLKPNVNIPRAI